MFVVACLVEVIHEVAGGLDGMFGNVEAFV